ncbi:hypothetical protein FKM82_018759 [Ascaphus truei]
MRSTHTHTHTHTPLSILPPLHAVSSSPWPRPQSPETSKLAALPSRSQSGWRKLISTRATVLLSPGSRGPPSRPGHYVQRGNTGIYIDVHYYL